jgi:TonB family protein
MSVAILHEGEARGRTGISMTMSILIHTVLLLLLAFVKTESVTTPPLTEVTLLDPVEAAAAMAASGPSAEALPAAASGTITQHFRRDAVKADVTPTPQSDRAYQDQMASRLVALQQGNVASPVTVAGGNGPNPVAAMTPSGPMPGGGGGKTPLALARGGGEGPPLALTRGGTSSALTPAFAATGIKGEHSAAATPAPAAEQTARRTLAGAALAGPIADRPILHYVAPVYPEWAKRDAVEGSVTLYFVVRADGEVKENVLVQKTAGFEDFDENARIALRSWKFEPLREGRTGEQWGTITFHYRLGGG